jgi:nitroreductase
MQQRRSLRQFSSTSLEREIVENCLQAAVSAPSGANKQPWTFCLIENSAVKQAIRLAAEKEEYENYNHRMSEEWLRDLEAFGTDHHKPFLESAPYLIAVFKHIYDIKNGEKHNNYYVSESVGMAVGILIAALHHAGVSCLTHTPSPMNFLASILHRPPNERAYLLMPIGFPAPGATVPDIRRKPISETIVHYA